MCELHTTEVNSREFSEVMGNRLRKESDNYLSLCKHIDRMFNKFTSLCVVEIELFHHVKKFGILSHRPATSIEYVNARESRKVLLEHLENELFHDSLLDYAWKLSYHYSGSYSHKLMIFLDDAVKRKGIPVHQMIKDFWKTSVDVLGNYKYNTKNCNDVYSIVIHEDMNGLDELYLKAFYMTQADHSLLSLMPNHDPVFGIGNLSNLRELSNDKATRIQVNQCLSLMD